MDRSLLMGGRKLSGKGRKMAMDSDITGLVGLLGSLILITIYIFAVRTKSVRRVGEIPRNAQPNFNVSGQPVIGTRILATRYGNDDTLEADENYYYFTHDTGGDLCAQVQKNPKESVKSRWLRRSTQNKHSWVG